MKIIARGYFIIVLFAVFISCSSPGKIYSTEKQDQCFYRGSASDIELFIKNTGDTAIATWFYVKSTPGTSITDTLIMADRNKESRIGRVSALSVNKNQLYFETGRPSRPDKIIRIKLKRSSGEKWIRSFNLYNNSIFISNKFQTFVHDTSYTIEIKDKLRLWNDMYDKYNLDEKLILLGITEFTREFEKFQSELSEKLRNY